MKPIKKIIPYVILLLVLWGISPTEVFGYFSEKDIKDTEFVVGTLGFALSSAAASDSSTVRFDNATFADWTVKLENRGNLPFQYVVSAENVSGNPELCGSLTLRASERAGEYPYAGFVGGPIVQRTFSGGDAWKFELYTARSLDRQTCEFDLVFRGWQTNIGTFGTGGFTHVSTMHVTITTPAKPARTESSGATQNTSGTATDTGTTNTNTTASTGTGSQDAGQQGAVRSLVVSAPQEVTVGQTAAVTWTSEGVSNVRIEFWKEGSRVKDIATDVPAAGKSFGWVVTDVPVGRGEVVIKDMADPATVSRVTVHVKHSGASPGGDKGQTDSGAGQNVSYNLKAVATLSKTGDIAPGTELTLAGTLVNGEVSFTDTIASHWQANFNDGRGWFDWVSAGSVSGASPLESKPVTSYTWKAGEAGPTLYSFRLCVDSAKALAESDEGDNCSETFSVKVVPPAAPATTSEIAVTSPSEGAVLETERSYEIAWTTKNVPVSDRVGIQLRSDGGTFVDINSSASNTGTLSWRVSADLTEGSYKIVVNTCVSGNTSACLSASSQTFTIKRPVAQQAAPTLQNTRTLTWTPSFFGSNEFVAIQLKSSSGTFFAVVSETPNDGSYEWSVADVPPGTYTAVFNTCLSENTGACVLKMGETVTIPEVQ